MNIPLLREVLERTPMTPELMAEIKELQNKIIGDEPPFSRSTSNPSIHPADTFYTPEKIQEIIAAISLEDKWSLKEAMWLVEFGYASKGWLADKIMELAGTK